jgi:hypothetical protein
MFKPVKPTASDSYPLGHAKENKDASAYTGFKYPAGGGDDLNVYKQPMPNPNGNMESAVVKSGSQVDSLNPSAGLVSKGNYKATKTDGINMRGYGAATKGIKSRGPMA